MALPYIYIPQGGLDYKWDKDILVLLYLYRVLLLEGLPTPPRPRLHTPPPPCPHHPHPLDTGLTFVGEASVSALLKFVPAELPKSPQFRGLHVDLVVRSVNISTLQPVGIPLTHAPLGSTLHVLVQVTSLDAVSKSTVRALMPGGLEPIDGNLDDDGVLNCLCSYLANSCLFMCITRNLDADIGLTFILTTADRQSLYHSSFSNESVC